MLVVFFLIIEVLIQGLLLGFRKMPFALVSVRFCGAKLRFIV